MTKKEEMLQTIYEVIARKDLTFGCRVMFSSVGMWGQKANTYIRVINDERNNHNGNVLDKIFSCTNRGWSHAPYQGRKPKEGYPLKAEIIEKKDGGIKTVGYANDLKIIGHDVMIGDVRDFVEKNKIEESILSKLPRGKTYTPIAEELRILRQKKREPIQAQSHECVTFVYSLIQEQCTK